MRIANVNVSDHRFASPSVILLFLSVTHRRLCALHTYITFTAFNLRVVIAKLSKSICRKKSFFSSHADSNSRGKHCTGSGWSTKAGKDFTDSQPSLRSCQNLQHRKIWKNITFAMSTIKLLLISLDQLTKPGQKLKNFFSLSQRGV